MNHPNPPPEYTPGPWHLVCEELDDGKIQRTIQSSLDPEGALVIADVSAVWDFSEEREAANAHLISAAPALLQGLEALIPYANYEDDRGNRTQSNGLGRALRRARAAVRQARGAAPMGGSKSNSDPDLVLDSSQSPTEDSGG